MSIEKASLSLQEDDSSLRLCPSCKTPHTSWVRCFTCGDRRENTASLSPYQRLNLKPAPLYSMSALVELEEHLLNQFHTLKTSRHLSCWTLRQRALICHDVQWLSSLGGALETYLKYCIDLQRNQPELDLETQCGAYPWRAPLDVWMELCGAPKTDDHAQSRDSTLYETWLLDEALRELVDYDGYQERSHLLTQCQLELSKRAQVCKATLLKFHAQLRVHPMLSYVDASSCMMEIKRIHTLEHWIKRYEPQSIQTHKAGR